MEHKITRVTNQNIGTNHKIRSVIPGKTYSNRGGIGEGIAYAAANVGIGAAGIVEGVTDLVSAAGYALTGQTDRAKAQFLDSWSGDWKRQLDDWYNPNAVMSFVGDVGAGVGNSLVAAIPYVGLPSFFLGAAGGGISSAAEKTGEVGFKEVGYGLTSGIIEGMLEKYVGPGAAGVKGIGTKALSSITKNTAKSAVRNSVWKQVLSNMGEEFLEESISEMIDPLMQRLYRIDPEASTSFAEVMRAGIIGGISGGILGGAQIGSTAVYDSSVGRTIAANGNSATVKHTAEAVLSSPFFVDQSSIKDEGILDLAGTLNSYNALTPEKLASGEGYRLLGAMKRQLFGIEARTKSAPYRRELLAKAEKTAAYATQFYGRNYTAEDIKADKDGILTHLTVLKWAGDAEVQARAAASVNAARSEAMAKGGLTNDVIYRTAAEMEAEENSAATSMASTEAAETAAETSAETASANSQAIENLEEKAAETGASSAAETVKTETENAVEAPKKITKYNARQRLDEAKAARAAAREEIERISHMSEGKEKARASEAARAKLDAAEAEISEAKRFITERYTEQADKKEASKAGRADRKIQRSSKTGDGESKPSVLSREEASRMTTEQLNERYDRVQERKNELNREYTAEKDEERRRELNRERKAVQAELVAINSVLGKRGSERYNVGEDLKQSSEKNDNLTTEESTEEMYIDGEGSDSVYNTIEDGIKDGSEESEGIDADAEGNDENAGTDEGDGDLLKPDARTERMLGSYEASVVEKARKFVRDFDLLSFERKVAVCELIDTSPNMGATELRAMCVLVAERDGLFAYSSPSNHKGVHKVLNKTKNRRLVVLSDKESVISGEGKGNVVGETIFHEITHDIYRLEPKAFFKLAQKAFEYVPPEQRADIQDRYTEYYTGKKYSEWVAKEANKGKELDDFLKECPPDPKYKLDADDVKDIISEEIVAGYVGKALGNSRYLKWLGDTQPSALKRAARTFNVLFRQLFGKNRFAEQALMDVYRSFSRALAETRAGKVWERSTLIFDRYDEEAGIVLPSEALQRQNLAAVETHRRELEEKYTSASDVPLATLMERYDKIVEIWNELGGELDSEFLRQWDAKKKDKAFSVFKAQAGYKYNIELSSMCKKGVPLFEAIDTIVRKATLTKLGDPTLDKRAKELLYDILKDKGFEIPCAICYVEQARQREGVIIRDFLNGIKSKDKFKLGWNTVLGEIEAEMARAGVEYHFPKLSRDIAGETYSPAVGAMTEEQEKAYLNAVRKLLNREIKRYNEMSGKNRPTLKGFGKEEVKVALGGTLPSNLKLFKVLLTEPSSHFTIDSDLLYSSVTTHNLAAYHTQLYSLFNSQGGVSGYKTKQQPIAYWGELLGKKWKLSTVRESGGIRNQSNSDGQMYTLLDLAQMYIDATAKGFYIQAYTKVLAELRLFGLSRAKINASLIPRVRTVYNADGTVNYERTQENAGLGAKGELLFDDVEGIPHAEALDIVSDPEYSKSVGCVCIGYSDNHILQLLDDARIQLVIGFHDKTDNPDKRYRGARFAKNYNGLNEAVNAKGETVHIGFNQFVIKAEKMFRKVKGEFTGVCELNGKTYEPDDIPRLAADLYLDHCREKGYRPAYSGIDGGVDFSQHKNYYKLLADFSLYDSTGAYAPHRKVAYNMPDTVPVRGADGEVTRMKTKEYIKKELQKELAVRDGIAAALADESEDGVIAQFERGMREAEGDGYERLSLEDALQTLGKYDDVRRRHIENGEHDTIANGYSDIIAFIKNATKYNPVKRLHIGIINDTVADMVKTKTGKDIRDYDFVIASNFIAHIFDQHGNPQKESLRGHKAIDYQNIENILETVISPDNVTLTVDNNGAEAIKFERDVEGRNIAITITSTKKSTLTLKSAWIINKNSGGRTPSANANAFAGTSKTNGRSSTNHSIHENGEKVNSSGENNSEKSSLDDTERLNLDDTIREQVLEKATIEELRGELRDRGVSATAANSAADELIAKHYKRVDSGKISRVDLKRSILRLFVLYASAENSAIRSVKDRNGVYHQRGAKQHSTRHYKTFNARTELLSRLIAESSEREAFIADLKAYAEGLSSAMGKAENELREEQRIHGYQLSIMKSVLKLREMLLDKRIGSQEADALVKSLIDRITGVNSEAAQVGDRSHVDLDEKALARNLTNMEELINGLLHDLDEAGVLNETTLSSTEEEQTVFSQYVPKDLIDEIRACATRVAAKKGERITADEYELIARMMLGLRQWYKDYDLVFFEGQMRNRGEVLKSFLSDSYDIVGKMGEKKGVRGIVKTLMQSAAVGFLDTHAVWATFDGYRKNGLFSRLWDQLESSMAKQAILKEKMLAERDAFFRKHKNFELELKTRKVKYQGHEITLGEAITIMLTAKREQAFLALYGSDMTVMSLPTVHFKGKGFYEATETEMRDDIRLRIEEIRSQLKGDSAVTEYIGIAERFFNETSKGTKKDADERYFGYTNVEDGYYIPISRDKSAFSPDMLSAGGQMDQFVSVASLPFNKHLIKKAKAALVIGNINDLINRHADGLSKYATMYQPVNAVNRLLGKQITVTPKLENGRRIWLMEPGKSGSPQSLMKILTDAIWEGDGEKAKKYFRDVLNSAQGFSQKQYNAAQKLVDYITQNATVNALGLNIKSVMSQLAGIPLAGYAVSPSNLLKGLTSLGGKVRDLKAVGDVMDRYSEQAHSRNIDGAGVRVGALTEKMGHSTVKAVNTLNKISDATMAPISATDRLTFLIVWEAAQYQAEASGGHAIGTEENLKMAGKIVDEFAKMTQPTVSAANSAAARTDNVFAKAFMRFTSANNKMFSRMVEGVARVVTLKDAKKNGLGGVTDKEIKEASAQTKRLCEAVVVSQIMLVGLVQLFKLAFAKDRDDDETVAEDVVGDIKDSFIGLIPVVSQINGLLADGYEISDLSFDAVNDTFQAMQDLGKIATNAATGEAVESTEVARVLRNAVYNIGAMSGIPVRNTWNNLTGLIKRVSPSAGANINAIFYDPTAADLAAALGSGNEALAETLAELMLARRGGKVDYTAAQEFLSLYSALDDDGDVDAYGVMPRTAKDEISVDGKSYVLNAKQYKTFKQVYGGVASALSALVTREDYKALSEKERAKAVKSLYSLYYSKAATAALGTTPAKSEVIASFVSDVEGYVSALAYASGIEGDGRKDKILAYLKRAGLSVSDQTWVLASLGYKAEKEKAVAQIRRSSLTEAEKTNAYNRLGVKGSA